MELTLKRKPYIFACLPMKSCSCPIFHLSNGKCFVTNLRFEKINNYLDSVRVDVKDDMLNHVSAISCNNDAKLGKIIAEAYTKVGKNGVVLMETSQTDETYVDLVDGVQIECGLTSANFVTNTEKHKCELENPYILIVSSEIPNIRKIQKILEHVIKKGRALLIVAPVTQQVKGLFTDIVGTLSPILTLIGKIAEFTATLPGQFALAGAAIGKFIIPRLAISAALAGVLSPLRLAAGLGAIGGIIALTRSRPGNDVAMSNNMLVTKNAGTIMLNNDDTVIAGTNLGGGIDYDKMAMAMSKAQVNVTTKYDSFSANSTTSVNGRYQSIAKNESKFL